MSTIGVVLLNYQTYIDTIHLVDELQKQSIIKFMYIIVVDNASPNDSFIYLKQLEVRYSHVKVIKNSQNLGYARGNNVGIHYLQNYIRPDYIAILNNDIILSDRCFELLLHRYKKLTNPAIIAPLMKTSEGRINLPNRLNNFLDDCVSMFLFANKLYTHNKYSKIIDNGDRTMIVDLIPGSFMFVSAQIFEEIGYFNPSTFLYNEEAFIAHEVKIKGLKNYILLDVDYIHAHKSPTISKSYNTAGKYNLLYNSIVRYTLLYRKFPVFKILILRILKPFILLEKYLYDFIRNII